MRATYECEQCFTEYEDEDEFVECHGDACHELVCRTNCTIKCKNPTCFDYVCKDCRTRYGSYCGDYCINCAIWDPGTEDGENESNDENFDYVAKGMTREQGLEFLERKEAHESASPSV